MKPDMVTKLVPFSMEDTVGVQAWLQEQAGKGLRLTKCKNSFFTFEHDEPVPLRYRVDPTKGHPISGPPQALLDLYAEYGWKYVDSYNRFFHVFVTDNPDALEPFHSPETLAQVTRPTTKRRILWLGFILVNYVLSLLYSIRMEGLDFYTVFLALIVVPATVYVIYDIRAALEQDKKIKTPGSMQQSPDSPPYYRGIRTWIYLLAAVWVVILHNIYRYR